jgi:hypothetical protein
MSNLWDGRKLYYDIDSELPLCSEKDREIVQQLCKDRKWRILGCCNDETYYCNGTIHKRTWFEVYLNGDSLGYNIRLGYSRCNCERS